MTRTWPRRPPPRGGGRGRGQEGADGEESQATSASGIVPRRASRPYARHRHLLLFICLLHAIITEAFCPRLDHRHGHWMSPRSPPYLLLCTTSATNLGGPPLVPSPSHPSPHPPSPPPPLPPPPLFPASASPIPPSASISSPPFPPCPPATPTSATAAMKSTAVEGARAISNRNEAAYRRRGGGEGRGGGGKGGGREGGVAAAIITTKAASIPGRLATPLPSFLPPSPPVYPHDVEAALDEIAARAGDWSLIEGALALHR